MNSTTDERKSVSAKRFIRILWNKIYKYIITCFDIKKYIYNDKLDDLVNEYNNTYDSAIKMKPVDVKPNTDINSSKEITDKDPKFKICYIVGI